MAEKDFKVGTLPWKCENCKSKLGMLDADRNVLTIKVKDAYIWIRNGDVSMTCRNCGSINTLEQESEQEIPEQEVPEQGVSEEG